MFLSDFIDVSLVFLALPVVRGPQLELVSLSCDSRRPDYISV